MITLLLVLAVVFLLVGGYFVRQARRTRRDQRAFTARARTTSAEVVGLNEDAPNRHFPVQATSSQPGLPGGQETVFFPVVRFTTGKGTAVETELMYGSRPAPARIGQTVVVAYDPATPTRAALSAGRGSGSLMPVLFTVLGVGLGFFGVLLLAVWVLVALVLDLPS